MDSFMEQSSQTPIQQIPVLEQLPHQGQQFRMLVFWFLNQHRQLPRQFLLLPPSVPAEALPELDAKRKNQSLAWEHFTRMKNPDGSSDGKASG
ncbi:hypothetical protein M0R45_029619 [Rubus argutus]|uniref:Uncharacterized protein n=1 Tax=Rubus argutus TaxID=59490 RepID=A0AAW1W8S2_RUBAR